MSLLRVNIDLAFPLPLSPAVQTKLNALKGAIVKAKAYAVKINEGRVNEEISIRAVYHICKHDTGEPCEKEIEIK